MSAWNFRNTYIFYTEKVITRETKKTNTYHYKTNIVLYISSSGIFLEPGDNPAKKTAFFFNYAGLRDRLTDGQLS